MPPLSNLLLRDVRHYWSTVQQCQCLIGQGNYDIRDAIGQGNYDVRDVIKRLGHVASTEREFRPGLDHNAVLGIEILR